MSNYFTHTASGAVVLSGIYLYAGFLDPVFAVPLIIGTILPDTDHREALAGKMLPLWTLGLKHRHETHSIFFAALFGGGLCLLSVSAGLGLFTGIILHLLLDSLTPQGLPKLWFPLKKKGSY